MFPKQGAVEAAVGNLERVEGFVTPLKKFPPIHFVHCVMS